MLVSKKRTAEKVNNKLIKMQKNEEAKNKSTYNEFLI